MKKQGKKISKDAPVKAKKAAPKKAAKKAAKKPELKKEKPIEKKVELPKPTPPQPEVPQPETPPVQQVAPAEIERLTITDQQKLLFKYGARIDDTDLSGTKDEVLDKVFRKTGDSVEDIRKYLED